MYELKQWDIQYCSPLSIDECIKAILNGGHSFHNGCGLPLWYKSKQITATQLLVTFLGGVGQKQKCTKYYMDFYTLDGKTMILMHFYKELGFFFIKMWSPFTNVKHIDMFIDQKIKGTRVETGPFWGRL